MPNRFDVIFEDPNLLVLSKPAGLLSQGGPLGEENLVDLLREYLGRHYVGMIHRLDRNTSGIMVFAKRSKAAQRLSDALINGLLKRRYRGIVLGQLLKEVRWRDFLKKDETSNKMMVDQQGKEAVMKAWPLKQMTWKKRQLTYCEFELETGRSHQIRAQAAHHGHPLLGDLKYGVASKDFSRPALHSYYLSFPHPISKEILEFKVTPPEDMQEVLKLPPFSAPRE